MLPKVSVVIPLFNKEKSIFQTVNSVLKQSFTNFEIVIIDDGSTDDSLKILSKVDDKRLKVYSKKNEGVSKARNFGVKKAIGDYIFFLDGDDIITVDCLSHFIDLIDRYKEIFVFTANFKKEFPDTKSEVYCTGKKEGIVENTHKAIWERTIFPRTGALLIKKECFKEVGYFQDNLSVYEDLEFILKLIKKYKIVYTPLVVLSYQCEYNELSQKAVPTFKDFAFQINLDEVENLYEKLILSEVLYGTFLKRNRMKDYDSCKQLIKKHKKHLIFIIWEIIIKKYVPFV